MKLCATPLGELTRPTAVGAPIEVRTSQPGQECQPTHLTRRAPPGDPPGGDRLTRWQMSLYSLCSSSQRSPQGSTQADDGREPAALYAFAVDSRPNGGKAKAQPRGKDANSSQTIANGNESLSIPIAIIIMRNATTTEWISARQIPKTM